RRRSTGSESSFAASCPTNERWRGCPSGIRYLRFSVRVSKTGCRIARGYLPPPTEGGPMRPIPPASLTRHTHGFRLARSLGGSARRAIGSAAGGASVFARRHADRAAEVARELALVVEAGARRDLGAGDALSEQALREGEAQVHDVGVRRQPHL